jgi:hypothetical protein
MATQTQNKSLIVENLRAIQTKGGYGNFVIFEVDKQANYYIQFTGQKGNPVLYAEAASNQVIKTSLQLSHQQQTQIEALGWSPPSPGMMNYFRDWLASSDDDLLAIAKVVIQTFNTGYKINPNTPLTANLNLE